jgi:hypothetical protein
MGCRGSYAYPSASSTGNRTSYEDKGWCSPKRGLLRHPSPSGRDLMIPPALERSRPYARDADVLANCDIDMSLGRDLERA